MSQAFKGYVRDLFNRFDKGQISEYQLGCSLRAYTWAVSNGKVG